jgi:DNA-binding GntR family transcriptional regulator
MQEKIYQTILKRILFLEYPPGVILNEKNLTEELGIGRGPLRDALKKLEYEHLVIILPRTGTVVTEIDFTKMMKVYQIRFAIEELAARLASENITDEQLSNLKNLAESSKAIHHTMDRKELLMYDFGYRKVLYEAANNPMLTEISNTLFHLTLRFHSTFIGKDDIGRSSQLLFSEIEETHKALSERDTQKAGKIRSRYIREYLELSKAKF